MVQNKLFWLLWVLMGLMVSGCGSCSYFSLFDYHYAFQDDIYKYNYWEDPPVIPDNSAEEAVMLIGGKHCLGRQCQVNYTRVVNGRLQVMEQTFPSHDFTIKFFTQFGFCRLRNKAKLPTMPMSITSVGAVALPDGRVIICGGVIVELVKGARIEASNSTDCWYWVHGTTTVKPLEYYSKLPFHWLGPFTPMQMQLVHFEMPPELYEQHEGKLRHQQKSDHRASGGFRDNMDIYEWWNKRKSENPKRQATPNSNDDDFKTTVKNDASTNGQSAFTDGYSYGQGRYNLNEFYRILILPWPAYTDAYRVDQFDRTLYKGGDLIEGHVRITKSGPRIFWKKHKLHDMPLGYGGCYVVEQLKNKHFRIHTFGGREIGVDVRGFDTGWTQNPDLLAKFPRNFDIALQMSVDKSGTGGPLANTSGDVYFLRPNATVERLKCRKPITASDNASMTNANGEIDDELRADFLRARRQSDSVNEEATVRLEQDRIFHTCHILPTEHMPTKDDRLRANKHDIILIGGGTGKFFDRPSILGADYAYTPIYRQVARFKLDVPANCTEPPQPGKGFWIADDKTFGYGLNIPRTRHASEIIKTLDPKTNRTKYTLWVFGGYTHAVEGNVLDTLESFEIGETPQNFKLWDARDDKNEWKYRLPWPLLDITTVKIPISWLPRDCRVDYYRQQRRQRIQAGGNNQQMAEDVAMDDLLY